MTIHIWRSRKTLIIWFKLKHWFLTIFFSLNFQVRWLNTIQGSSGNMRFQNWQILSVVCVAKKIIFLLLFKSSNFYNSADLEILFGFLCLSGERFKCFWKWRMFYNNAFWFLSCPVVYQGFLCYGNGYILF